MQLLAAGAPMPISRQSLGSRHSASRSPCTEAQQEERVCAEHGAGLAGLRNKQQPPVNAEGWLARVRVGAGCTQL